MASGGARARSGPPPDPMALRRDRDAGDWTELPAEGREGDAPDWPLPTGNPRELALWAHLWGMPQAVMWERMHQDLEVALYCRQFARFELPNSSSLHGTLLRQMGEALGLTTPGLRVNRWKIAARTDQPADAAASTSTATARPSTRDRFKVVPGGAA